MASSPMSTMSTPSWAAGSESGSESGLECSDGTAAMANSFTRLAYKRMLPSNPAGVAFLFSPAFTEALRSPAERVAIEYGVEAYTAIEELRRLLAIKTFVVDTDAVKISPTPLMDELWHAAVLDTRFYAELNAALGLFLHHRPSGARDDEAFERQERLTIMRTMYQAFFNGQPFEGVPVPRRPLIAQGGGGGRGALFASAQARGQPCPAEQGATLPQQIPPNSIEISTLTGRRHMMKITSSMRVQDIQYFMQDTQGIPPDVQRIHYAGRVLEDGETLQECGINAGSRVLMVMYLRGC